MSNWELRGRTGRGFYRCAAALRGWALVLLALGAELAPSCQTVSVTGRKQFNMFSIEQDKQLGAEAYAEVIKESKLVTSGPQYEQVKRVVERLIPVVDDPGFEWEFHVIDDPKTVNAWCMPGGKMAVYTGILPVTEDDAGLAVVMGHEIAHAIARHGTERMSTQGLGSVGLAILASQYETAAQYQQELAVVSDLLVFKPWGRDNELEADHIGLMYMARAGYDPRTAPEFWKRMSALAGGQAPPEFLSTHPSDERRIAEIEKALPEALALYDGAAGSTPRP
jgi:predicted Zn-dependent protease